MDEQMGREPGREDHEVRPVSDSVSSAAAVAGYVEPPFVQGLHTGTEAIVAALRTVEDPEIPVNIYDLGLVYKIGLDDKGFVEIVMTLTAPGCPVAGDIVGWVEKAVRGVDGVANVKVNLVFDPPWDKSRMSDEVKLELGLL
jgi:FeS assembly SUF system protein